MLQANQKEEILAEIKEKEDEVAMLAKLRSPLKSVPRTKNTRTYHRHFQSLIVSAVNSPALVPSMIERVTETVLNVAATDLIFPSLDLGMRPVLWSLLWFSVFALAGTF